MTPRWRRGETATAPDDGSGSASSPPPIGLDATSQDLVTDDEPVLAHGKGKVTPKRSDARAKRARQRKTPMPKTRKELSARRRQILAETRESMKSTDVAKLPSHERVPELVLARDLVDARRNLASASLVVFAVYLLVSSVLSAVSPLLANATLALAGLWIAAIITDSVVLSRRVQAHVRERYPSSTVPVRSYAIRRASLPRRFRRPVSRLRPGDDPWGRAAH